MQTLSKSQQGQSAACGAGAAAAPSTPSSNTGRKNRHQAHSGAKGAGVADGVFEPETVEVCGHGRHARPVLVPVPRPGFHKALAFVDWLAFTIRPRAGETVDTVIAGARHVGLLTTLEARATGYAGYQNRSVWVDGTMQLGLIAWGGEHQRSTVYVSVSGAGCAKVADWQALQAWLSRSGAVLTRLDLAHDDLAGEIVTIEQAVAWYVAGAFNAGGRTPRHELLGDWLDGEDSTKGRTLRVGGRQSGKLCRVYEKGKQLGDPNSPLVRVEVEWHNKARLIPLDALTSPGPYLAGAYPCLKFLSGRQVRVRTTQRAGQITFERAMRHGRHAVGKLVNLALAVHEGDYVSVVEALRRAGYPARVEPFRDIVTEMPADLLRSDDAGTSEAD